MKKIFLGALFTLGITLASQAQRYNGNQVIERTKFGIQGGLSVPWQSVGGYSDYSNNSYGNAYSTDAYAGFTAGINVEMPLGNGWYLQPEANYTQMGGKDYINSIEDNAGNTYGNVYTKFANNYLQVPVYVKYKPMLQGFGIFFGPQYGYLLSAKEKYASLGEATTTDVSNRNEFSLAYGLEYYFPSANDGPSFGFSIKGISGLTNIVDKSKYNYAMSSVRNNGFFLTAGVRF